MNEEIFFDGEAADRFTYAGKQDAYHVFETHAGDERRAIIKVKSDQMPRGQAFKVSYKNEYIDDQLTQKIVVSNRVSARGYRPRLLSSLIQDAPHKVLPPPEQS